MSHSSRSASAGVGSDGMPGLTRAGHQFFASGPCPGRGGRDASGPPPGDDRVRSVPVEDTHHLDVKGVGAA
jgi:hypothetical protein